MKFSKQNLKSYAFQSQKFPTEVIFLPKKSDNPHYFGQRDQSTDWIVMKMVSALGLGQIYMK